MVFGGPLAPILLTAVAAVAILFDAPTGVPESASLLLLGVGFAAIAAASRRRRKQAP